MNMRKVITVNLNHNAYSLDEDGHDALAAYLDTAEQQLAGNPDRAEILSDLEQAIADKFDSFLGKHRNVVGSEEMRQVLLEMGPVDDTGPDGVRPEAATASRAAGGDSMAPQPSAGRRRLFRLPTEGMVGGVCAGLAAYFNIDVVWVRLAFVLLTLTTGIWFFAWVTLLIVMPAARTPEQMAAARGETLNAREVMEMARAKSAQFGKAAAAGVRDAGRNLRETFGR